VNDEKKKKTQISPKKRAKMVKGGGSKQRMQPLVVNKSTFFALSFQKRRRAFLFTKEKGRRGTKGRISSARGGAGRRFCFREVGGNKFDKERRLRSI